MQFIRYESFRQYLKFYPVTCFMIAANVAVFIAMIFFGGALQANDQTLLDFGAIYKFSPVGLEHYGLALHPEFWRYIAAIFIHIGGYHLLFNSFALIVFAPPLERALGSFRYAFFYVVVGIIGNITATWLTSGNFIGAGASGSIYGIYAAFIYMAFFVKNRLDSASRQMIITIVIIGILNSIIVPHVSLTAHIGGFVGGFILMALISPRLKPQQRRM
ncbi:MAG: rhomboid family intramembrane serine protease [Gorillibacterium sp.]|nr:rhomboid family intramembrane serine protease [Gorillibacterium sp.]